MTSPIDTSDLLSLRELARRTGISPTTLRALRDTGELPVYQIGKRRQLVIMSEFWAWFRKHRVSARGNLAASNVTPRSS